MTSALIIGIDSTMGQALEKTLTHEGYTVFGTSRRKAITRSKMFYLDLSNVSTANLIQSIDAVYLCAGVTSIADCQKNPAVAEQINVDAPIQLADYFLNQGAHVIYLSSNAVFSGARSSYRASDARCPISIYGEHKAKAEEALLRLSPEISIVRLTKVLTPDYPLFMNWFAALKRHEPIQPFHHLHVSPVGIDLVAEFLKQIAEKRVHGITHLSGLEDMNYTEVARYLANLIAADESLISPVFDETPVYASLDMSDSMKVFDEPPDLSFNGVMRRLYLDVIL